MLEFKLNEKNEKYELVYDEKNFWLDIYPSNLDLYFDDERVCMIQYNKKTGKITEDSLRDSKRQIKNFLKENSINLNHLDILSAIKYVLTTINRLSESAVENSHDSQLNGLGSRLQQSPSSVPLLTELGNLMKNTFNIIRTEDSEFYYYNVGKGYYSLLDSNLYGFLVQQEIGVSLPDKYCKISLSSIKGVVKENVNLWEFANHYYLVTTSQKDYGVVEFSEPQLTFRKFLDREGNLLEYDPDVLIDNGENATLVEKTMREIFIPRNEPYNDKAFKDILYLIAEGFIIGNVAKNIICLYNPFGNNGKTLFAFILSIIYLKTYKGIEPKRFKDAFFKTLIDNSNCIVIDEIEPDSLKNHYHQLKNLTKGSGTNEELRVMHSDVLRQSKGYGVFYILCNELLDIDLNDEALLHRFLVYDLPNRFIEDANEDSNEYEINKDLFEEIANDSLGLQWLINASIKMYQTYDFKRQDTEFVKDKFIQENVIRDFVVNNTVLFVKQWKNIDSDDYMNRNEYFNEVLTTNEIKEILLDIYPYLRNWSTEKLLKRIGMEISRHYGNIKLKNYDGSGTAYMLKYEQKISLK